jgi:hypothetical protein
MQECHATECHGSECYASDCRAASDYYVSENQASDYHATDCHASAFHASECRAASARECHATEWHASEYRAWEAPSPSQRFQASKLLVSVHCVHVKKVRKNRWDRDRGPDAKLAGVALLSSNLGHGLMTSSRQGRRMWLTAMIHDCMRRLDASMSARWDSSEMKSETRK